MVPQSHGPWLFSSHSVDNRSPPPSPLGAVRRGSSYVAEGLDGAGLGGGPGQAVPHGGRAVGGRVQGVLVGQGQHHGVGLRLGFPKERLFDGLRERGRAEGAVLLLSLTQLTLLHLPQL